MTYPFQFPKDCKLNSSRNPYRWNEIGLILGNASLYTRHNTSRISSYIGSYSMDAHATTASKSVRTMFTCSPVKPLLWRAIRFPIFWGHKLEAKEQSLDEMNDILERCRIWSGKEKDWSGSSFFQSLCYFTMIWLQTHWSGRPISNSPKFQKPNMKRYCAPWWE